MEQKKTVVLIAFYNVKALGVRYLETALEKGGYRVKVIFFKGFNSQDPEVCTAREVELCVEEVVKENPVYVGLSVMSRCTSNRSSCSATVCGRPASR